MPNLMLVHFKSIGGTIAMRQANLNYAEEISIGASSGEWEGPAEDRECVALIATGWVFNEKTLISTPKFHIVSMILFCHSKQTRCTWISQSWTNKRYRRIGLHTRLFNKVAQLARGKGILTIGSKIAPNNIAMIEAAKKQGRIVEYLQYDYKLY